MGLCLRFWVFTQTLVQVLSTYEGKNRIIVPLPCVYSSYHTQMLSLQRGAQISKTRRGSRMTQEMFVVTRWHRCRSSITVQAVAWKVSAFVWVLRMLSVAIHSKKHALVCVCVCTSLCMSATTQHTVLRQMAKCCIIAKTFTAESMWDPSGRYTKERFPWAAFYH